ncbi:hypothetical protein [Deinococcus cellulosilyticus]|uniref:Uncharacterized protein n=1 Tax=Deinococcus cellulosilyticus (strain DSM 18568 / NBRC 106333 / KACC 11606 / 5516J-15) TaxID=1223518 RepID=A0A511MZ31_DEIC1|nr:hypothetical protein [Deinococcus cellulosilyticus]GEM45875.1 hypothetical protein DC3_15100 [Deinococcus cellulosilyticus NBRC 106333 = KACC 11606]
MNQLKAVSPRTQVVPQAPLSTPADGVYQWTRVEPFSGVTEYLATFERGRLIELASNGSTEDRLLILNQVEAATLHSMRQHKHEKVA